MVDVDVMAECGYGTARGDDMVLCIMATEADGSRRKARVGSMVEVE
jgi:hypothetical protein